jgi:hypothetical protein
LIGWAGPKDPPNLTPQSPQSPLRPPVLTQQAPKPQQSGPGPLSRPRPGPASRKIESISRIVADLHPIVPKPGPTRIVAQIAPRNVQR